jgi:hypothetical protein
MILVDYTSVAQPPNLGFRYRRYALGLHTLVMSGPKLFKRRQLAIQFGDGLLQHLPMAGVAGGLKLLLQPLPREEQSLAFPFRLLFFRREWSAWSLAALRQFLLLLFHRLTLPAPRHWPDLTLIKRHGAALCGAIMRSWSGLTPRGPTKICLIEADFQRRAHIGRPRWESIGCAGRAE